MMADPEAVRRPGRDPEVIQRLGSRLRRFVGEAGWSPTRGRSRRPRDEGREVVLTLRSSAAELYSLPWELFAAEVGHVLGELEGLCCAASGPRVRVSARGAQPARRRRPHPVLPGPPPGGARSRACVGRSPRPVSRVRSPGTPGPTSSPRPRLSGWCSA